jgi:aerobic-type carbon monoxide dehydrogenase small subunit (CoxS/CutS family)
MSQPTREPLAVRGNVQLTVNGTARTYRGDGTQPLLWYLRDELQLTGTKFGCGIAACGACTVHVDGQPQRACVLPMQSLAGKSVTTIEALAQRAQPHAVVQAWMEENVPQCGYCQAGQMMSAAALLARAPKPDDAQIDAAMKDNLCRCGTYARVRKAIHRAAQLNAEQPK